MNFLFNFFSSKEPETKITSETGFLVSEIKDLKKKEKISHALRSAIWDYHIGKEKGIGLCYCCQNEINSKHFECGHIISEKDAGKISIENLRPICGLCNRSMGTRNMDDFRDDLQKFTGKWYEKKINVGLHTKENDTWYIKSTI